MKNTFLFCFLLDIIMLFEVHRLLLFFLTIIILLNLKLKPNRHFNIGDNTRVLCEHLMYSCQMPQCVIFI